MYSIYTHTRVGLKVKETDKQKNEGRNIPPDRMKLKR